MSLRREGDVDGPVWIDERFSEAFRQACGPGPDFGISPMAAEPVAAPSLGSIYEETRATQHHWFYRRANKTVLVAHAAASERDIRDAAGAARREALARDVESAKETERVEEGLKRLFMRMALRVDLAPEPPPDPSVIQGVTFPGLSHPTRDPLFGAASFMARGGER